MAAPLLVGQWLAASAAAVVAERPRPPPEELLLRSFQSTAPMYLSRSHSRRLARWAPMKPPAPATQHRFFFLHTEQSRARAARTTPSHYGLIGSAGKQRPGACAAGASSHREPAPRALRRRGSCVGGALQPELDQKLRKSIGLSQAERPARPLEQLVDHVGLEQRDVRIEAHGLTGVVHHLRERDVEQVHSPFIVAPHAKTRALILLSATATRLAKPASLMPPVWTRTFSFWPEPKLSVRIASGALAAMPLSSEAARSRGATAFVTRRRPTFLLQPSPHGS